MRKAILIGNRGGKWTPISEVLGADYARLQFKEWVESPPAGVSEIELWESGSGVTKRKVVKRRMVVPENQSEAVETKEAKGRKRTV